MNPKMITEPRYVRVLVDYNTKVELGAASDEMCAKFEEAQKIGRLFTERIVCGVSHRVVVVKKQIATVHHVANTSALEVQARAKAVTQTAARDMKRARESERELAAESELGLRWPPCHCTTSTLWTSRRLDGPRFALTAGPSVIGDEPEREQRTCFVCGGTSNREIGR